MTRTLATQLETLAALPLEIAVLEPTGTIREVNAGWRTSAEANGLGRRNAEIGQNYLHHCTPDQAAALDDLIAGRCDLVTALYACHASGESRWMLMVGLPQTQAPPRRVALVHMNVSALLPFDPGTESLRAIHHSEVLSAPALEAIVHAVEHSIARTLAAGGAPAGSARAVEGRAEAAPPRGARPAPTDPDAASPAALHLPKRQREVLELLGAGLSNAEIAGVLGISANTAKLHVAAVLRRLGLGNRMQAVAFGARLGRDSSALSAT